jgi:hypothetical protein
LDLQHAEHEVMGMPIYQGVTEILERPLSRLPDRVAAMIEGAAEAPDERAAGALLIALAE